jgi:CYTH domain-containing protein
MAREIERKILVRRERWRPDPGAGVWYRQGYLSADPDRVVRVRVAGDRAFLTIKGRTRGIERPEFEYPIPLADANTILDGICMKPLIEKTRYRVRVGAHTWEVDAFAGDNAGLLVAEIELPWEGAPFDRPEWLGAEVSGDPRYFNSNLVQHPHSRWGT